MEPQTDLLRKKLVEQFDKGLYCDIKLKAGIDGTEWVENILCIMEIEVMCICLVNVKM